MHGVTWTDREGLKAERTEYFKGANPAADTKRTFDLAGLLLFTDARISQYPDAGEVYLHFNHFMLSNYEIEMFQPTAIKATDTSRAWLSDVSTRIGAVTEKRIAPTDPTRMTASLSHSTVQNPMHC